MTRTQRTATIVAMATGVAMMLSACGKAAPTATAPDPESEDITAQADVSALAEAIGNYWEYGHQIPAVTQDGDHYIVGGTSVDRSPNVVLGGVFGESGVVLGASTTHHGFGSWCVYVTNPKGDIAVTGYEYATIGGLAKGNCAGYGSAVTEQSVAKDDERRAEEDEFIKLLNKSADAQGIFLHTSAVDDSEYRTWGGVSDSQYLAWGREMCDRGQGGENWVDIIKSGMVETLFPYATSEHDASIEEAAGTQWKNDALALAVLTLEVTTADAAATALCPDQYDIEQAQIGDSSLRSTRWCGNFTCDPAPAPAPAPTPAATPAKETTTVLERAADSCNVSAPHFAEGEQGEQALYFAEYGQGEQALFLFSPEGERMNPDLNCVLSELDIPQSIMAEINATGDGQNGSEIWDGIVVVWKYGAQSGLDVSLTVGW